MKRLEIVWLPHVVAGAPPRFEQPLTDEAGQWEISVESRGGVAYVVALGYATDADSGISSEHVVPLSSVRSVSARRIDEDVERLSGLRGVQIGDGNTQTNSW